MEIEDKELDALIEKRRQEKEMLSFEKKTEEIIDRPKEIVEKGVNAAVHHTIMTSEEVKEQFLETADRVVKKNLSAIENKADAEEKKSILLNNKDACDLYGIDESTVPKWVIRCVKRVQDFWYAIWLVIGFFTTAPVVFLGKKLKVVIKRTWVAMVFAALIYVVLVSSPVWLKWLTT